MNLGTLAKNFLASLPGYQADAAAVEAVVNAMKPALPLAAQAAVSAVENIVNDVGAAVGTTASATVAVANSGNGAPVPNQPPAAGSPVAANGVDSAGAAAGAIANASGQTIDTLDARLSAVESGIASLIPGWMKVFKEFGL